jgi:hypothetical protein
MKNKPQKLCCYATEKTVCNKPAENKILHYLDGIETESFYCFNHYAIILKEITLLNFKNVLTT